MYSALPLCQPRPMGRTATDLLDELWRRVTDDDDSALDELVAEDLVNHAGGPQGLVGLRTILAGVRHDLGATRAEHHRMFGDGDLVTHHVTLHGTHRASTMPLLQGVPPTGSPVAWTFIHIWRARDDQLGEHWACRDDVALLAQIGAWPTT